MKTHYDNEGSYIHINLTGRPTNSIFIDIEERSWKELSKSIQDSKKFVADHEASVTDCKPFISDKPFIKLIINCGPSTTMKNILEVIEVFNRYDDLKYLIITNCIIESEITVPKRLETEMQNCKFTKVNSL
jgi:hypothetical protein